MVHLTSYSGEGGQGLDLVVAVAGSDVTGPVNEQAVHDPRQFAIGGSTILVEHLFHGGALRPCGRSVR